MKKLLWVVIILLFLSACTTDLFHPHEATQPIENLYAGPPPTGALARLGRGVISEIALSPDGEFLAVASGTGLYLYSLDTFQDLWSDPVTNGLQNITWSPDGGHLAGGTASETMIVWDAVTGERSTTIKEKTAPDDSPAYVYDVAWSPDGEKLAFGDWDRNLTIWDAQTGERLHIFEGDNSFMMQVAWSPDGKKIAAGLWNGSVLIWDAETGEQDHLLEGHTNIVLALSWSPSGMSLASGALDGVLAIWDPRTGEQIHKFEGFSDYITSLAWSFEGERLAVGGADGFLAVMDANTGEQRQVLEGHLLDVISLAWLPVLEGASPDGSILFSAGEEGLVKEWDVKAGTEISTLERHTTYVQSLAWSPDSRMLAAGTQAGVDIWAAADSRDNDMGTLLLRLEDYPEPIAALGWSPDGGKLAAGSWEDNVVVIWDPATGDRLDTFEGHLEHIASLAWSPDGELLASGADDGIIILWDTDTGEQIQVFEGHEEALAALAWSPDGSLLASSSYDETVIIWDVDEGEPIHILADFGRPVSCVDWSPDGTHIAAGSWDETVSLWNVETAEEGIVYRDHVSLLTTLDWSPDGTRIASGAMGLGQVLVWDTATGKTLYTLEAHGGPVTAVAWSPDGSMLASASMDGTVILWDAALLEIPPVPTQTPGPSPTPTLEPQSIGPFRQVAPAEVDFIGDPWAVGLYASPGGKLYLYSDEAIAVLAGSTWELYLSDLPGYLLGFDERERVWVANEDGSQVSAWNGRSWKSYGAGGGWVPFTAESWWDWPVQRGMYTDPSGQIWLGTFEDLRVFDGASWMVYSLEDMGMPPPEYEESSYDFTFSFLQERAQLWVGACDTSPLGPSRRGGLSWFDGEDWHAADAGIPQGCAGSVREDDAGRIWAGVDGDVWLFDPTSGVWKSFTPPPPLPPLETQWYGRVTDITLDPAGHPWITFLLCGGAGCEGIHLLYYLENGVWTQITASSFQLEGPQQLLVDGAGTAWLFWNGIIYKMTENLPEPVASLNALRVVLDADGQLWFLAWYEGHDWLWTLETE